MRPKQSHHTRYMDALAKICEQRGYELPVDNRAKNKLQEHFQRLSLPLPTYHTTRRDDDFSTVVTLHGGKTYNGYPKKRKIDAELSAAMIALQDLTAPVLPPGVFPDVDIRPSAASPVTPTTERANVAILVDLENQPRALEDIRYKYGDGAEVWVFFSQYSAVGRNLQSSPKLHITRLVAHGADAVDAALLIQAGRLIERGEHDSYVIYSHRYALSVEHLGFRVVIA